MISLSFLLGAAVVGILAWVFWLEREWWLLIPIVIFALALPAAADAQTLSLAQGRWFTEREVHRWAENPRFGACWSLTAETVACEAMVPRRVFARSGPRDRIVELCERDGEYVRLTLSSSGVPLSPAETQALGFGASGPR